MIGNLHSRPDGFAGQVCIDVDREKDEVNLRARLERGWDRRLGCTKREE